MLLSHLNEWYTKYSHFWALWKSYKLNGLQARDIALIECYRQSQFYLNTCLLEKIHRPIEIQTVIESPLVEKLQRNYQEYREWVVLKFTGFLIKEGLNRDLDAFFECPIDELPFHEHTKQKLKRFGINCLQELGTYSDSDLTAENNFALILNFSEEILEQFDSVAN